MLLTAAILAGGASRRMGTDKAALEIGALTVLERTVSATLGAGLPALIVGRAKPAGWSLNAAAFVDDASPGLGPLAGLATALKHSQTDTLALACDLPLLSTDAVGWLAARQAQGNTHGVIVVNGEQWEPLFSIYRPACLPLLEARLADGRRSLHGLIAAGEFGFAEAPDWVAGQLVNVNTPEEWERAKRVHPDTPPD